MNSSKKFYTVKVQIEREVGEEKTKLFNEQYIVDAISCTDAESIIYKYFEKNEEAFKVIAVTETKIIAILDKDSVE